MPPELLTTAELADRLGESEERVLAWARAGRVPAIKVGRQNFYNLRSVLAALRKWRAEADAEPATAGA